MFTVSKNGQYVVTEGDMEYFAQAFLNYAKEVSDTKKSLLVSLKGDLGAGKTTFSKTVGKLLGVEENITSPTFVIQKTYQTKDVFFKKMVHIDVYRIEVEKEVVQLGIHKTLEEPNTIVLIEWPEKIPKITLESNIRLEFVVSSEETRTITVL